MKARHEPILLGQLEGENIPGGCDDCDAFQRFAKDEDEIWTLTTFHDDDCQVLRAMKAWNS